MKAPYDIKTQRRKEQYGLSGKISACDPKEEKYSDLLQMNASDLQQLVIKIS